MREWHARYPGTTSATFWYGTVDGDGRSSYAILVEDVALAGNAETVVDLACGDGYLLSLLADRFHHARLIGVDMTPEELALARERRLPDKVTLRTAHAEELPFDDAGAGAIVCHMAFMLFDDAQAVCRELARILRPGGIFAAVLGPAPGSSGLVQRFGALLHEAEDAEGLPRLDVGDPATFAEGSLRALFGSDTWSDLLVEDIQLRFEGTDEQVRATLLGMYNVARLSATGQRNLSARLAAEMLRRRTDGESVACLLGLRHLVAKRALE